jgi:hypothetical protein
VVVANMRVRREPIDANVGPVRRRRMLRPIGCPCRTLHPPPRERLRGRAESTRDPEIAAESYGPNMVDPRCRAEPSLESIVKPCIQCVWNYNRH